MLFSFRLLFYLFIYLFVYQFITNLLLFIFSHKFLLLNMFIFKVNQLLCKGNQYFVRLILWSMKFVQEMMYPTGNTRTAVQIDPTQVITKSLPSG